jgi:hypothetical protein
VHAQQWRSRHNNVLLDALLIGARQMGHCY